jgi:phospholipid-binding lipoprotein MlaA
MPRFHAIILALVLLVLHAPALAGQNGSSVDNGEAIYDDLFLDGEMDQQQPVQTVVVADPLEPVNRALFQFNDKLYFWLLKPVATGYGAAVPEPFRNGIANAFRNLAFPIRFVSSLLQGKPTRAGKEIGRFVLNTTCGVAGLFNVADEVDGLHSSPEDLGQTLGRYGLGHGVYLVLPVLGPSSLRDAAGRFGDSFLDPVSWVTPREASLALRAEKVVNTTSLRLGEYEDLKEASLDPYTAFKDAYLQYRRRLVRE